MANYEDLYFMVLEKYLNTNEHPELVKFKSIAKNIKNNIKDLKKSIKERDKKESLKLISLIEKDIDAVEKIGEKINPDDYKHNYVIFSRLIGSFITCMAGLYTIVDLITDNSTDDKNDMYLFVAAVGAGVTGTSNSITTSDDARREISRVVRVSRKRLDKLKKMCESEKFNDKKDDSKLVKEFVDDIKLEIYESCYYGEISEEERDTLLNLIY